MKNIVYIFVFTNITLIKGQFTDKNLTHFHREYQQYPKPTLLLLSTQWCDYCHALKKSITQKQEVRNLLNKHFYTILIDAETKKPIELFDNIYTYRPNGFNVGKHDVHNFFFGANETVSYPHLIIYQNGQKVWNHNGYISSKDLVKVLNYIIYKTKNIQ